VLSAGGGLDLGAAATSPASVTTSSKAADVVATTTTRLGLIGTPCGAGKVILPALGVWPGPVAFVGGVPGCEGEWWVCVWCCRQAAALI